MHEYYHSEERQLTPSQAQQPGQQFGLPFGQQFGPLFGQLPGQQFGSPFGGAGVSMGPPSDPPPSFTPQQTQAPGVFAVDPGAIRPCTFRFVYIWLNSGERFWAWLVFVGRRSASGWRWTGFRWIYFGVDLRNIQSFVCF
ncbi:MAG: hypothetical protein GX383_10390 [Clostridium sp.]|nr:hypothetical protein [Clostridium sp.]